VVPGAAGAPPQAVAGGAAATSGLGAAVAVSEIGMEDLDPEVRQLLREFRTELELFFVESLGVG
jgi:hypothetical protein